jgi:hypothetical protein
MAVPRTPLPLALAAAAALALAGCTSSGDTSASAPAAAGGGGADAGQTAGGAAGPAPAAPARPASGAAPAAAVKQRLIRTAQLVVQVDGELAPAAAKVRAVAEGLGGTVSSETTTFADAGEPGTTTTDPSGDSSGGGTGGDGTPPASGAPARVARPGQSLLVLRVPEPSLDRALALITGQGGVGKELSRSGTAQDVTADIADLQSRVATQRASVERVRALLGKAGSLRDVVMLEAEVSKREADLEALEARRAALADRADLATLTVDLRTAAARVAVAQEEDENAFLEGLGSGWKALTSSLTVILTILGALLPLAILAAIVGAPLLWALRRRRRGARPAPPAQPASPAPAATPGAGS